MEPRFFWKRLSWPLQIAVWLIAFYLAWNIIPMGYGKLTEYYAIDFFQQQGLPFGLFLTVGAIEVFGPILACIPRVSFYGSFPLVGVMVAASYYNGWLSETLIYAGLALLIAFLARPGILRKKPDITTVQV